MVIVVLSDINLETLVMAKTIVHCFMDYGYYLDTQGQFGSEEWVNQMIDGGKTCMLENGHSGDHEWVSDNDIVIEFKGSI